MSSMKFIGMVQFHCETKKSTYNIVAIVQNQIYHMIIFKRTFQVSIYSLSFQPELMLQKNI